jgi:hypothetical protein
MPMRVLARAMVAFVGEESFKVNEWKPVTLQSRRSTRTTLVVAPGAKLSVPLTPTYRLLPLQPVLLTAVLLAVAYFTDTMLVPGALRLTRRLTEPLASPTTTSGGAEILGEATEGVGGTNESAGSTEAAVDTDAKPTMATPVRVIVASDRSPTACQTVSVRGDVRAG